MKSRERQLLGIGAIGFTVLLWGLSGVAIKATSVTGIVTAFYRTWFAIPLLWLTMLSPTLRSGLDRNWLRASIVGGVLFCVHQVLYFTSLKLTTVANVTIIGALQPVLVLLSQGACSARP
jgi:drug/metabolite transporter (DMT)-like permease